MISQNNFFLDQEKIKTVDTFRIIYFVGFLVSLGLTKLAGMYTDHLFMLTK